MHTEVMQFFEGLKKSFPEKFESNRTFEAGGVDINGTVRSLLSHAPLCVVCDLCQTEDNRIDIVLPVHEVGSGAYESFDFVFSTEMLEHDIHWKKSIRTLYALTAPGGLLAFTCAGPARAEHGTHKHVPDDSPHTLDHYRNLSIEDVLEAFELSMNFLFSSHELKYERSHHDLLFWGIKK